jgi:hypothetical protein
LFGGFECTGQPDRLCGRSLRHPGRRMFRVTLSGPLALSRLAGACTLPGLTRRLLCRRHSLLSRRLRMRLGSRRRRLACRTPGKRQRRGKQRSRCHRHSELAPVAQFRPILLPAHISTLSCAADPGQ